jgi:hypothetical protein
MIDSLKVGKIVYSKIGSLVSNRCYPLIAENGTTYPFIIYQRDSLDSMFCKDGVYEDEVNVSVRVVTDSYNAGIDLAQSVREAMTFNNYTSEEGGTYTSLMVQADEEFTNDAYVQTLIFRITINN